MNLRVANDLAQYAIAMSVSCTGKLMRNPFILTDKKNKQYCVYDEASNENKRCSSASFQKNITIIVAENFFRLMDRIKFN